MYKNVMLNLSSPVNIDIPVSLTLTFSDKTALCSHLPLGTGAECSGGTVPPPAAEVGLLVASELVLHDHEAVHEAPEPLP